MVVDHADHDLAGPAGPVGLAAVAVRPVAGTVELGQPRTRRCAAAPRPRSTHSAASSGALAAPPARHAVALEDLPVRRAVPARQRRSTASAPSWSLARASRIACSSSAPSAHGHDRGRVDARADTPATPARQAASRQRCHHRAPSPARHPGRQRPPSASRPARPRDTSSKLPLQSELAPTVLHVRPPSEAQSSQTAASVGGRMGAIEVRGLEREFKGGVHAVDGIDLEVAPGEVYGFLGPTAPGRRPPSACSSRCCARPAAARAWPARRRQRARRGAPPDRRRAAGGGARPAHDRPRADRAAGDAARHPARATCRRAGPS